MISLAKTCSLILTEFKVVLPDCNHLFLLSQFNPFRMKRKQYYVKDQFLQRSTYFLSRP